MHRPDVHVVQIQSAVSCPLSDSPLQQTTYLERMQPYIDSDSQNQAVCLLLDTKGACHRQAWL